ncbi:MAG: 6-phospho-beta-glucosidase, partial [Fusobacteriaceae bacterium]
NNGVIEGLSADAVIETTAIITSSGAIALKGERLPSSAEAEVILLKTFEQLTIEAAINADYGKALQALTINPLVKSGTMTKKVLDIVLKENEKYLSRWKG